MGSALTNRQNKTRDDITGMIRKDCDIYFLSMNVGEADRCTNAAGQYHKPFDEKVLSMTFFVKSIHSCFFIWF
jgi:hypothetical protein